MVVCETAVMSWSELRFGIWDLDSGCKTPLNARIRQENSGRKLKMELWQETQGVWPPLRKALSARRQGEHAPEP